jgi:phage terminase large subunit-like protein
VKNVQKYIEDIKSGEIKSCIEVQQAIDRYEKDLLRDDLYFNLDKVNHVFTFFSYLQHTKDRYAGKFFELTGWEKFFISQIFGWYWKSTNKRRFKEVYLSISKKNGKTALAAGIMLYCLLFEGSGNFLVLASNSREQAQDIDFKAIDDFCINLDYDEEYLTRKHNTIHYHNSVLKCISSENRSKAGLGLKVVYIDEFFEFANWKLYNNLKSSQIDLDESLFIVSTTAGTNKSYPCFELHTTAKEILAGLKTDDQFFTMIYALPEELKENGWKNPNNFIYSNPNLNVTVQNENLLKEITRAKNNISLENDIKTQNFNIWCDVAKTWIPDSYILKASKPLDFSYFEGESCVIGVDLSEVSDLTAISFQFIMAGNYHYINKYYLPVDNLNSTVDQTTFQNWEKQGFITLIAGNRIDYVQIANDIQSITEKYNIYVTCIGFDSWHAKPFATDMKNRGYKMIPVPQSIGKFSAGTLEFTRLMLGGNIVLDNNKITRWCFANCSLAEDANGNKKPSKSKSANKIDGSIAILTALNCQLSMPQYTYNI